MTAKTGRARPTAARKREHKEKTSPTHPENKNRPYRLPIPEENCHPAKVEYGEECVPIKKTTPTNDTASVDQLDPMTELAALNVLEKEANISPPTSEDAPPRRKIIPRKAAATNRIF